MVLGKTERDQFLNAITSYGMHMREHGFYLKSYQNLREQSMDAYNHSFSESVDLMNKANKHLRMAEVHKSKAYGMFGRMKQINKKYGIFDDTEISNIESSTNPENEI